jgi:hypothetical protein
MNRYVFTVANRVFEIHIESPAVPRVYETACFEVLEGRQERRLIPIVLNEDGVVPTEMRSEQDVLLGARALLRKQFENRPN